MKSCLDISKLRNVHEYNEKTIAQCPACAETGGDDSSEHLFINSEGAFGCIKFPGPEGAEHRKRIFALVGVTTPVTSRTRSTLITTYDYLDASGHLLFQVCRLDPKSFRQRHSDESGNWIWNMEGVQRVLYRLPALLVPAPTNPVFICEGEKDVHAIESLGLLATCNPGGAGKWHSAYTKTLVNRLVIIIADKDDAGRKHAELVAKALHKTSRRVRVIELPDRAGKLVKDAHDWISAGGTLDELKTICKKASDWQQGIETPIDCTPAEVIAAPSAEPVAMQTASKPESFYYERFKKEYMLRNQRGCWLSLNESQFKKELMSRGIEASKSRQELISQVDQKLIFLRGFHDIDYAGRLAGYDEGFYDMNGQRILVTESPHLVLPVEGDWSLLREFFESLFVDGEYDQISYFMGWLKMAYECLQTRTRRPGQALVLCGPKDCGKSLCQQIITVILGGRMEKPYQFMVDKTSFNSDLFKAEHLCIDDEPATCDIRSRISFGSQIKQIAACDNQRCHGKGREALTLTPFWRLTISVNSEPENLMVLPPLNDSLSDKLMLFKTCKHKMPMLTAASRDRAAFWKALISQLPAFLFYLNNWQIEPALSSERYGITHFHHPDLLRELDALSPEFQLLNIIRAVLFNVELPLEFLGTSQELEALLTSDKTYQYDARKLLSWPTACGTYLSRLAKKFPDNFIQDRSNSSRSWTIIPFPA